MQTDVKPSGGCRTCFALPGPGGDLQQFSWADLRRDKMGVWTLIDGRWERVRSNRDLKNLGSRAALAPLGSSPEELLALSSVCPSSLTAKDIKLTLRFRELLEAGPLAALSNSFTNSSSAHEKLLLELIWGREDHIFSLTSRHGEHVTAYYLSVVDNLTDIDIAVLLDMMAQPTREDVWQEAADDLLGRLAGVLPKSVLNGPNGLTKYDLYYAMQSSRPGHYTDPSLASDVIELTHAIFTSHSLEQRDIMDAVTLARDLVSQHGSARVAMCYLTGLNDNCSLKESLAVYNLGKYGPLDPSHALELVRLVGCDPALIDLISSELYSTGSLDVSKASFIKDAYDQDPIAAMFQFATSSRAVTALFEDSGSSISKDDAAALAQAFGFPSLDRANEDLRALLESVSLDDFSKMLAYSKLENKSGVPDAELALRLSLAFGPRAEEYLKRMTVPSLQRVLLQREESVVPKIASSVLLARAGKEYIDSAESLDDRRLRRQEVGNAQAYSQDALNQRLEILRNSIPAINDAETSIRAKISAIHSLDQDQQDRQEILRLDTELRSYPATLASKETEIKALEAVLAGYDPSSKEELSALVKDWVLATPTTTGKNAGLSLHDAAFWLPTDPEVAASLGRWMLDGDRSEKIFARPTSISDMTLITAAWSDLVSESDPLFGNHAKDSAGVTRSKNDAVNMSFGRVLERSRTIAASADLGDRFTSALSKTGATATSSQRSLDLLRESFETPTPFPLEKMWTSDDPASSTLRARFIPRDDVRGTQLGMLTNCCQHLEGAGRTCAESGQTHPAMGFFAVEDAAGNVVSQSWVWADGSGGVCFDNVEGFPGQDRHDAVVNLYTQASKDLLERFDRVTVGAHNAVNFSSAQKTAPLSLSSVGYNGYSDARNGQLLLASRSQSDSNNLITLGLSDGFTWRQGDSSVTVRPDGLVFDGPQAASIAERMLPSMGSRTWQVSGASGSFSLDISDNPHLKPSIENLPLTLFDPTPVELEKIASFAPEMTPVAAASWFKQAGRDLDLIQTAVNNGWDPESVGLAMRSDNYGRRMLSAPMPPPEVVHGVSLGLSPERAAIPSIQGVLAQAAALAPDVLPSKISSVLPWAARSSSPAIAAAALSHCESETQYPVVLSLVESGVAPNFVRSLARQQSFQSFEGPFDAKYADRIASLSPEAAAKVDSYMHSGNRQLMHTDYFHPEIMLAIAHQPQEVVDAVLSCDRSYRTDPRTIDYVLSGGSPGDWGRVERAVGITDPGVGKQASGAFLATVSQSQLDEIDKVLDSVRVERAHGENSPPHYYSPGTLAVFADKQALAQAAEVVTVMNASADTEYFSYPGNSTDFAGVVSARIRPQDAEILARHGVTARTLASACRSQHTATQLTGEHVAALASIVSHPDMPQSSQFVLLHNPSLIDFASDVFSSADIDKSDLALFERVVSSSVSADQIVFAQAWADPSNRTAICEASSRRGNLNQLVASALKKSSVLRSLGGFHGSLFKEPDEVLWSI